MKKILFLIAIVLFVGIHSLGFAAIQLGKWNVHLDGKPGETIKDTIEIANDSDKAVTVNAYVQDFSLAPSFDGKQKFLPIGSLPRSCSKWVSISPPIFILGPREKKELVYSLKIPEGANGSYWGILFFRQAAEVLDIKAEGRFGAGLGITISNGYSIFVRAGESRKQAGIENVVGAVNKIEADFVNAGNILLRSEGSFYVMDEEGTAMDRGEIKKVYLPPDEKVSFETRFSEDLPEGNYTAVITFDLGDEDALIKEVDFAKRTGGDIQVLQVRD